MILLKDIIEEEADFVQKPFSFEILSGKVRQILDRSIAAAV